MLPRTDMTAFLASPAILKLAMCILILASASKNVMADPDPNFHIYLMFGQSNMEGMGAIEEQDKVANARVKVMSDLNCSNLGRTYGNWYLASPPLNRCWSGIGPGDYFGKSMADGMPASVTIGLVPASIAGTPIELYQKSAPLGRNGADIPAQFSGGYAWLLDMAKKAQEAGVIKGIIFHQGESNTADPNWKYKVQEIVTDLRIDLGIGDVPFLAGELLYADYGACCHWHNPEINKLPSFINNAHVISAEGLVGADQAHFTTAAYREFGKRYAAVMLPKVLVTESSSSSSANKSSSSSSLPASSSSTSSSSSAAPASSSSAAVSSGANQPATAGSGGGALDHWILLGLAVLFTGYLRLHPRKS